MSFRIWLCLFRVGGPVLFCLFVFLVTSDDTGVMLAGARGLLSLTVVAILVSWCIHFGWLSAGCPFCGSRGRMGSGVFDGPWLDCPECGRVQGRNAVSCEVVRGKDINRPS